MQKLFTKSLTDNPWKEAKTYDISLVDDQVDKEYCVSSDSNSIQNCDSQSTLSISDRLPRQVRHQRIAINNIKKLFEKLVVEREQLVNELRELESRRFAQEIDLQNVQILVQKYTLLESDLSRSISSSKVRESKLNQNICDLDTRLELVSDQTVNVESLVKSLKPVEKPERNTPLQVYFGHLSSIETIDFGSQKMVSGSADKSLRVWDLDADKCLGVLDDHDGWIRDVQIQGFTVISGSGDHTAKLWDISVFEDLQPNQSIENNFEEKVLKSSKEKIEEQELDPLVTTFYGHNGGITCLQFQDSNLITGSTDKSIRCWDINTGGTVSILCNFDDDTISSAHTLHEEGGSYVSSLHFYKHALAAGFGDGIVRLFDLRSLKCHRSLVGHVGSVSTTIFDDYEIITGSLDRTVRIWDLRMGKTIQSIEAPGNITNLSIDHSRIAVACGLKDVKLYSRINLECETLVGHGKVVRAVKLSGGRLASGGYDATVRMWALAC